MSRMRSVLFLAVVAVLAHSSAGIAATSQNDRQIVLLSDAVKRPAKVAGRHARDYGVAVGHVYRTALKGYAAEMSAGEAKALRKDPAVVAVGPDPEGEPASQVPPPALQRTFATSNSEIGIDGVDERVDADIAILDTGIAYDPDLNVVARTDCFGADPYPLDATPGDHTGCRDGGGRSVVPQPTQGMEAHGTWVARIAAALDNDLGDSEGLGWDVGVAPGARLWSVQVADLEVRDPGQAPFYMSDVIAGVDWVTEHADRIEVANMSMRFAIPTDEAGKAIAAALESAIEDSIAAGVVYVVAAGNEGADVSGSIPAKFPAVITASAIFDNDGKAGGEGVTGVTCLQQPEDADDTNSDTSNYGSGVDIAAPGDCTSNASAYTAGAAALLASMDNPQNAADVAAIRNTLRAEGNTNPSSAEVPGWDDESGDGAKEPLLDVSDEGVFDPELDPAPTPLDAESDVDGDGRSDLIALRNNGVAYVHPGTAAAKFDTGVSSFGDGKGGGILDPALHDGVGFHVIDVAEVTGDDYADLVTVHTNGTVYVAPGSSAGTFGVGEEVIVSLEGVLTAPFESGGSEPVAVADVNGDGDGDLVVHDDQSDSVSVKVGDGSGKFTTGLTAASSVDSALHDTVGEYFVDVADVTGEGRADLVSITAGGDLRVYRGQSNATFAAPVASQEGKVKPAMANSSGFEPVGLGDVDGDGRADLVVADASANTIHVYEGHEDGTLQGTIGVPVASFGSETALRSTAFQAGYFQLDLVDVDGDGRADLRGVLLDGTAYVWRGLPGAAFARSPVQSSGTFLSTQHGRNLSSAGNEFVTEKPSWRRRGCAPAGCDMAGWLEERGTEPAAEVRDGTTGKPCGHVTQLWLTVSGGCVVEDFTTSSYEVEVPIPGQMLTMDCEGVAIESLHVDESGWFAAAPADVDLGSCDFWVGGEKAQAEPCPSHGGKTPDLLSNPWSGFLFRNQGAGIGPSIWLTGCFEYSWEEHRWQIVDALYMELESSSQLASEFIASQAQMSGGGEAWGYEMSSEDWSSGGGQTLTIGWGE